MARVNIARGEIGVEPISLRHFDEQVFRFWLDKGAGKYRTIEVTFSELQRIHEMLGGVLGGSRLKPPRAKYNKSTDKD